MASDLQRIGDGWQLCRPQTVDTRPRLVRTGVQRIEINSVSKRKANAVRRYEHWKEVMPVR